MAPALPGFPPPRCWGTSSGLEAQRRGPRGRDPPAAGTTLGGHGRTRRPAEEGQEQHVLPARSDVSPEERKWTQESERVDGGRWTGAVGVGVGVGGGRASQVRCASLPVGGGEEIAGRAGVPSSSPEPTARPALHHMGSARRPARDHRGPVIQGPRGGRSARDSPAVRVSAPAVAAQLPGSCLFSEPNLFCPTLRYATPCHAVLVRIVLS